MIEFSGLTLTGKGIFFNDFLCPTQYMEFMLSKTKTFYSKTISSYTFDDQDEYLAV